MMPLKPGEKANDDHVRLLIENVNRLDDVSGDHGIVLIALAAALARQPHIDRTALHADFIEVVSSFIVSKYGSSRELNGFAATVAYYLNRPE
jgi:hypothetical protein